MFGKNRNPELQVTIGSPDIAIAYFSGMLAVASTRQSWHQKRSRIRAEDQSLIAFENGIEFPVEIRLPRTDAIALRQSLIGLASIDTINAEEKLEPSVKALIGELTTRLSHGLNELSVNARKSQLNVSGS